MKGAKFLAVVVLLAIVCSVMTKKSQHKDKLLTGIKEKMGNEKDDRHGSKYNDQFSKTEEEKLLKLITTEGNSGWFEMAKKEGEKKGEEMKNDINNSGGNNKDFLNTSMQLDSAPSQLITQVTTKLSGFTSPLATRVKDTVSGLDTKWSSLSDDERAGIAGTLGVISGNIEKFGNAGGDPLGAIKGAVDIIASIASNFGPKGQLISMGLGFVSSLLALFGKGPEPKPLSEVVREQIDQALAKYRDEALTAKAQGLVRALQESKAYLDGAAKSGNLLSEQEMLLSSSRIPITQGSEFLGELASVIDTMLRNNREADARKCIKYCELYAQLTALREMILTQFISLTSNAQNLENDVNGLIGYRQNFRDATKIIFLKLYTIGSTNLGSKILPYYDPETSVITDSYATSVLKIGTYDRSLSEGLYCLMTQANKGPKDMEWQKQIALFRLGGKPYVTIAVPNNNNCYWKLVPHGSYIFSIVNKKKCAETDGKYEYCGSMLSWDKEGSEAYVNIDSGDPVLWEIVGNDWKRIRSKWGCDSGSSICNKELRILSRKKFVVRPPRPITLLVGQLAASDGRYYWKLRKRT